MPRIDAPTVAEHHRRRRAALIGAGRELLASGGVDAVTPATVGAAAGLARSSVYQYFDSTATLIGAIVEDAFPRATAALRDAVNSTDDPRRKVDAYLAAALDLATDATHRTFDAIPPHDLPPEVHERVDALHREQYAPLIEALTAIGVADVGLAAQLLGGMLSAAARAVSLGADHEDTLRALLAAAHGGIIPAAPHGMRDT